MGHLQQLNAMTFHKNMGSGRTKPCLLTCESGDGRVSGEFVVKLKGSPALGVAGIEREMIACLVGNELCIPLPDFSVINIGEEFLDALPANHEFQFIRNSGGLNFGTTFISDGFNTCIKHQPIPDSLVGKATEVIAFDAFLQNPDRRDNNPNLLTRHDEIYAYDHDMSFSFLQALFGCPRAWEADAFKSCLITSEWRHVFYDGLKGKLLDLDGFASGLNALTSTKLAELLDSVPVEWRTVNRDRIRTHLEDLHANRTKFIDSLRSVLS
jgi:hypothetical protein